MAAVSADLFLSSTFELYPAMALSTLRAMRLDYENPPMDPSEFLVDLMRVGLGRTAALARKEMSFLSGPGGRRW